MDKKNGARNFYSLDALNEEMKRDAPPPKNFYSLGALNEEMKRDAPPPKNFYSLNELNKERKRSRKQGLTFHANTKNWNGRRKRISPMNHASWLEIYGDVPKSDHFLTDDEHYEASISPNRPKTLPGPYEPSAKYRAIQSWRNKMAQGIEPNTPKNYDLSTAGPGKKTSAAITSHLERYAERVKKAGYELHELKQNQQTGVWYAKICREGLCTYQVVIGPSGTMSGGKTRRKKSLKRK
jgi:hypothetical protein